MRLEERTIADAAGTILMRNLADAGGNRILKKGTFLGEEQLDQLAGIGLSMLHVAVLEASDVHEDDAALVLAEAMQTRELYLSRPVGGRVNLRAKVDGLLEVDAEHLVELNLLPGITLGTRRQHAVVDRKSVV